jgi:hypothetical protein
MKTLATLVCATSMVYCISQARESHKTHRENTYHSSTRTPLYSGLAGMSFLGACAIQVLYTPKTKKTLLISNENIYK